MNRTRIFVLAWGTGLALAACGGLVVVDGATSLSGAGGDSATTGTGAPTTTTDVGPGTTAGGTSASSSTSSGSVIQVPTATSANCHADYYNLVMSLESALGCVPTAKGIVQCSGVLLLHDPCGCFHVANESEAPVGVTPDGGDLFWDQCLADGCCGPNDQTGCGPCPPVPTTGHCDAITDQCVPGP